MKRIGAIAVAAVALSVVASQASAQLPGVPNYPIDTGTHLGLAADYAKPEGGGEAYGLQGSFGFSRFGVRAGVGGIDNGTASEVSYGGGVSMRLIGGGLNPLSVGAQVGATQVEVGTTKFTSIQPGAWVKFSPPLFPIKPFGSIYYVTGDNVTEETRLSIGANLNLLLGFGFHGAYDWGDSGYTWGVGAHFMFRVGIPGV